MKITSSYKVEILHMHEPLKKTMAVSRAASAWLEPVIDGAWDRLSLLTREKERFMALAEAMLRQWSVPPLSSIKMDMRIAS